MASLKKKNLSKMAGSSTFFKILQTFEEDEEELPPYPAGDRDEEGGVEGSRLSYTRAAAETTKPRTAPKPATKKKRSRAAAQRAQEESTDTEV